MLMLLARKIQLDLKTILHK
uniref:Uncharacterized protein n=1 Tax=Arundo donax TaxID=35708 RepID=A0A0A9Q1T3_ARUDO